jgi:hypothetical protein
MMYFFIKDKKQYEKGVLVMVVGFSTILCIKLMILSNNKIVVIFR